MSFRLRFFSGSVRRLPSDETRAAVALTVQFWNANVLASHQWSQPNAKPLSELRTLVRSNQVACCDAAMFDRLSELWRDYWLDPRLSLNG